MFVVAQEYVSTRPLLVFVPLSRIMNGGAVDTVWQSRLTSTGTRLRLERGLLHCRIDDRWYDARLTAAIHFADTRLPSDKAVLVELIDGLAVVPVPVDDADCDVESVDIAVESDLLSLIRIDASTEFAMLMAASEDLRFAAEEAGLRVIGEDIGQDRFVAISISTPVGDELLRVECDTSFGEWHVIADGRFEGALGFANLEADGQGRMSCRFLPSELESLFARFLEALPEVCQAEDEIRDPQMAM
jgi:hypothetical protein